MASDESDLEFYARRAREERKAARHALGEARALHERLADEYEAKVKELRGLVTDV